MRKYSEIINSTMSFFYIHDKNSKKKKNSNTRLNQIMTNKYKDRQVNRKRKKAPRVYFITPIL